MNSNQMLADLVDQAAEQGTEFLTLRAIVEEASTIGAQRVLHQMGLDDAQATGDLIELRQLLRAWRDAKTSARKAVIEWVVRGLLALLLLGFALRFGATDLLK